MLKINKSINKQKMTNKKITITAGAPQSPSSAQGEQPPCWLLLGLFRQQETLEDLLRGAHKVVSCLAVNWVWSDMMKTLLRKEEVTDLYICGIATDVCVGQWLWIIPTLTAFDLFSMGMRIRGLNVSASTAFHSQELGFRTILIEDASRGIKVMKSNSDHVFFCTWK